MEQNSANSKGNPKTMKPFTKLQEPITMTTTVSYEPTFPFFDPGHRMITISFPLPSIKRCKHPGGRVLRKSRLRKKQAKYCRMMGYSTTYNGFISDFRTEELVDGEEGRCSVRLQLLGAVL